MSPLAHGGTVGLLGEISIGALVGGVLAVVWLRERRRQARKGNARMARGRKAPMND